MIDRNTIEHAIAEERLVVKVGRNWWLAQRVGPTLEWGEEWVLCVRAGPRRRRGIITNIAERHSRKFRVLPEQYAASA